MREKNVRVGGRCEALLRSSAHTAGQNDGAAAGNLILPPQPLTMTASAADLVPAVEAYLEANGLSATLKALKSEASAKKMTPSKSVRAPETLPEVAIFFRSHRRRRMRRSPREMRPALTTASRFCLLYTSDAADE